MMELETIKSYKDIPDEFTQVYSFLFPNLVLKVSTNLKSLHIDFKFSLPNSP